MGFIAHTSVLYRLACCFMNEILFAPLMCEDFKKESLPPRV